MFTVIYDDELSGPGEPPSGGHTRIGGHRLIYGGYGIRHCDFTKIYMTVYSVLFCPAVLISLGFGTFISRLEVSRLVTGGVEKTYPKKVPNVNSRLGIFGCGT